MNRIPFIAVVALVIIAGGGMFLTLPSSGLGEDDQPKHIMNAPSAAKIEYWTCGMHPSVHISLRQYDEGNTQCPICSMDLVPVSASPEVDGEEPGRELGAGLAISGRQRRLAGIETTEVRRIPLFKEIYTVGTITYDEGKTALVSAWAGGRIDRLFVDFTGVPVKKGEHLVSIYSPQLIIAQEEYLLSLKASRRGGEAYPGAEELFAAGRRKLLRLGLTEEQIAHLESEGRVEDHITVFSPIGGTVIHKNALEGMYVKEGEAIYRVADLSRLWIMIDIYEYELGWVRLYQEVEITTPAFPGEVFRGRIVFIEPFLDPETRTAGVRVDLPNPDLRFKPEMYVNARIRVPLGEFGLLLDPELEGKYICPMHPEAVAEQPGPCPRCGMETVKVESQMIRPVRYACPMGCIEPRSEPGRCPECGMVLVEEIVVPEEEKPPLAIPKSAVLNTGRRDIVWVDEGEGKYRARVVTLGPEAFAATDGPAEPYYPVFFGLSEGEAVVTRGNFLLDSQSQLTGAAAAAYGGALGDQETPAVPGHQHH